MRKRLIYLAVWESELEQLVSFLKEKGYDQAQLDHFEAILGQPEDAA